MSADWTDRTVLYHSLFGSLSDRMRRAVQAQMPEVASSLRKARPYKLDLASSLLINNRAFEVGDLADEQRVFAKPPHDYTFVEFTTRDSDDLGRLTLMGVLFSPERAWVFFQPSADAPANFVPAAYNRLHDGYERVEHAGELYQDLPGMNGMIAVARMFFLTLHFRRTLTVSDRPAFRSIVKGKLRAYAAHSLVSIDLNAEPEGHLGSTGERGTPRAHEVRGSWVNYHKNPRCDHAWKPIVPDFEGDERERYECPCGQRRTWRRAHQRGDASLGYVTHEYRITAS